MRSDNHRRDAEERRGGAEEIKSFLCAILRVSLSFCDESFPLLVALLVLLSLTTACRREMKGTLAFVSNERDGTITVIDVASDKVVQTISVNGRARGIRIGPDNRTVYVALSTQSGKVHKPEDDRIAAIDILSGEVVASYNVGTDPEKFALSPDGKRLYISNEDAGTASVTEIATNKVIATQVVGLEPEGVTISPDGRWVYVTSESSSTVAVIDTGTNRVVKTFIVGARPRDLAFTPDGSRAFVTAENGGTVSVIDVATHTVTGTIELPREGEVKPMGVGVSPDGQRVYVATGRGNSLAVIDAVNSRLVAMIPVGKRPWGVAVSPDGRRVYTANGLSNDVSVVDTASNKVIATIKAGDGPWGITIREEMK